MFLIEGLQNIGPDARIDAEHDEGLAGFCVEENRRAVVLLVDCPTPRVRDRKARHAASPRSGSGTKRGGSPADVRATSEEEAASGSYAKSAFAKRARELAHARSLTIRLESDPVNVAEGSRSGTLNQSTALRTEGCSFRNPRIWPSTMRRMIRSKSSLIQITVILMS